MTAAQKLCLAALPALVLSAPVQAAVFLTESVAGNLSSACTLDGVPLADDTAFSFQGTFDADPAANAFGDGAIFGGYPLVSYTITLAGHGTYANAPGEAGYAFFFNFPGTILLVGFLSSTKDGPALQFNSTTSAFDSAAPRPTIFVDYLAPTSVSTLSEGNATFGLTGVPGGLYIPSGAMGGSSASISAVPVPEPGLTAALTGLGLATFALRRRARQG